MRKDEEDTDDIGLGCFVGLVLSGAMFAFLIFFVIMLVRF